MRVNHSTKQVKVALYSKAGVHLLVKDSAVKRTLVPLKQEQKEKLYPRIDTFSPREISKALDLYCGAGPVTGLVKYNNKKTRKAIRKIRKSADAPEKENAIVTLCSAPQMLEDQQSGYIVLSMALLAHVIHLLPAGTIPEIPAIYCGDLVDVPLFLHTLLSAVNGPDVVRGSSYFLKRPSCLAAQNTSPTSPYHSLTLLDYLGGTLKLSGKRYKFWLPLWATAVCIAPGLPPAVQEAILTASPSVVPFYCNKANGKGKWVISIPGNNLYAADRNSLQDLEKKVPLIHAIVDSFLRNATKDRKGFLRSFPDVDTQYSHVHFNRRTVGAPNVEARILAAAFFTLEAFLNYTVERGWLSYEKCSSLLSDAQASLFPDNNPSDTEPVTGQWDSEKAFWPFLTEYLSTKADKIYVQGERCPSDAIATVRQLKNDGVYLILPRFEIVNAYQKYCASHGLSMDWTDVGLSRAIPQWLPRLKREKDNASWQYNFYRKDDIPQGQKSAKLACLGFPIDELPESVKKALPLPSVQ